MCRHVSIWGFQNHVCLSVTGERDHPSFANIIPKVVIDLPMERSTQVLQHGNPKIFLFLMLTLLFLLPCFVNNACLAYTVRIDWAIVLSINIHVGFNITTCTHMTTSGMHCSPFEGRHLVFFIVLVIEKKVLVSWVHTAAACWMHASAAMHIASDSFALTCMTHWETQAVVAISYIIEFTGHHLAPVVFLLLLKHRGISSYLKAILYILNITIWISLFNSAFLYFIWVFSILYIHL